MTNVAPPAWSLPVRLDEVPEDGARFDLVADAATRMTLARLAGVAAVPRLEAHFDVTRHGLGGLKVAGNVAGTVRQTCVVTLEPLENQIDEAVDLTFMPGNAVAGTPLREEDLGHHEPPDTLVNGCIDLGAIATEFLILGIDPYPRKPGAVFAAPESRDAADHPFAPLAALKKRN